MLCTLSTDTSRDHLRSMFESRQCYWQLSDQPVENPTWALGVAFDQ